MIENLWITNQPQDFWQCFPPFSSDLWARAVQKSLPILNLKRSPSDINDLLGLTLGEGQFGVTHWTLSPIRRLYYILKPLLPRTLTRLLRHSLNKRHMHDFELGWPIEARYPRFQYDVLQNLLELSNQRTIHFCPLWPNKARFALVLTHDIETAAGQEYTEVVADMEENLGFRSIFNFVPERYKLNYGLMENLRQRGFEIGVHGLKHNGRLFHSKTIFLQNASWINKYLKEWNAMGFRAELTHRHPEWMQALEMEYDLSFFDTDPFEPIPGGTMSIWPFFIGHFVELPYTLVQDYTLTSVLREYSPRIWLNKVDFIEKYHGMALVNTHPDYLKSKSTWDVYKDFLNEMKGRGHYWHALPGEAARWWRTRSASSTRVGKPDFNLSKAFLNGEGIEIEV